MPKKTNDRNLILVVDDNEDILFNISLMLKGNKYNIITAKNGNEAVKLLNKSENPPDLIISDIMMPKMDGYEFFSYVSSNPRYYQIPFVFLSAKSTPEDIRLGKMLGADDYVTKPFKKEDLLATISGKLKRAINVKSIQERLEDFYSAVKAEFDPSISLQEKEKIILMMMYWDDKYGPKLKEYFPKLVDHPFSIEEIGNQLFQATLFIYGYDKMRNPEGILINLDNIKMSGYAYFLSFPDQNQRFKEKQYMIAALAPQIKYFDSLKIKKLFEQIYSSMKQGKHINLEDYWNKLPNILTTGSIYSQGVF